MYIKFIREIAVHNHLTTCFLW